MTFCGVDCREEGGSEVLWTLARLGDVEYGYVDCCEG